MSASDRKFGRLFAVDLTPVPEDRMAALRREAIRRGVPLPELLSDLVDEGSRGLMPTLAMSPRRQVTETEAESGASEEAETSGE